MEEQKVVVKVKIEGIEEEQEKMKELIQTVEKARTLASELTKELQDLNFNVENVLTSGTSS